MTELIWEGKYKEGADGRRIKVAPLRVALPFQSVETVNESAQERQKALDMFSSGGDAEWRNRLIWGDKKYVLPSLLQEFAGKVDLIYIDPPFATGGDFSFSRGLPESELELNYMPNAIEQKAYRDTWGRGFDSYLQWFYETATLLSELLSEKGSLYVHLDDNVSHYAKVVLDEVFGSSAFRNEIIWQRTNAHNMKMRYYPRFHDVLFFYTKSNTYEWNSPLTDHSDAQLKRYKTDADGRLFTGQDLTVSSTSESRRDTWRGSTPPPGRAWAASKEERERLWQAGLILKKLDGTPRLDGFKVFLDEKEGRKVGTIWTDLDRVGNTSAERTDYPTQKPETLLERIIKSSTKPGDLVLDSFCGSGTTAAVAEKLGRRWITCDLGRFAIHTARKRLLAIDGVKPFVVQNLGKYERQQWQDQEFGQDADAKLRAYRKFILDLYKGREMEGKAWLHGVKSGRMVHVGSVDSPISLGDVQQIAKEFKQSIGTGKDAPTGSGIDVLGWDFAFDLNETAKNTAREAGIDMRFVVIPREVLEKKAVEQGDIHFYELAAVTVHTKVTKKKLEVELTDFIMSLEDVPQDVQNAVKHWSQWIDYWAIDYDYKGDTFHNQWQSYRTRKETKLTLKTEHIYAAPGSYCVMVKVIDILGNDTTKTVKVEVK